MSDEELLHRIEELERQLKEERAMIQPIIDFWNASKIVGKVFVIIGGIITGGIVVITSVGDYFMKHWK